jgi:hypothetical protein
LRFHRESAWRIRARREQSGRAQPIFRGAAVTGSRVLIVEDDAALLRVLKDFRGQGLRGAHGGGRGIRARTRAEGASGPDPARYHAAQGERVRDLPCGARARAGRTIVMLTAKGQEEDIVLGLDLGADDYPEIRS